MSQFSTAKSPPWARPTSEFITVSAATSIPGATLSQPQMVSTLLSQPGVATNPTIYSLGSAAPSLPQGQYTAQQLAAIGIQPQPTAMAAPTPPVALPQPGIAIPTTLATSQVATISYPAPRLAAPGPGSQPQKQRVFTGTITKLHDNFGFVDEDIFFQTSCVKGSVPKMCDRVLVEATYNPNMPFKWNATRIQILPNQGAVSQAVGAMFKGPQTQASLAVTSLLPTMSISNSLMGGIVPQPLLPTGQSGGGNIRPSGPRRNDMGRFGRDRDRKRDQVERRDRPEREERRKRSRSPQKRPIETHPTRPRSPPRRRPRIIPRYVVQVSKLSFDIKESNVIGLKSRYSNMYVPSDFFNANFSWTEAFPLTRPFQIGHQCSFHIMHKDVVDPFSQPETVLDPPDADHLFSAKVMLLSCLPLDDFYHKCCALAEDPEDVRESFQHPTRLIQFLVGIKGKNEPMAIGGPWSPSIDGPNPGSDPRVLIKTAIRTTRVLTGIDLAACTQWYRFAKIHYLRPEETHKGKVVPARVETTVIFLPDVWTCGPTRLEWGGLQSTYRKQLQKKLSGMEADNKEDIAQEDDEAENDTTVKKEPTHHLELDPRTMKIMDLRRELESRNVSSKGLKSQLIARLTKALKMEQEKEEAEEKMDTGEEEPDGTVADDKDMDKKKEQEEDKKKEDREKALLERRHSLPDNPAILVHPNPQAKSGKFDCSVMSLSVLLDYRPEDNKEHSFEVSLFAELFNEMLMRDFAFVLYKTLVRAPEKKEEEKLKEKDKDKNKSEDKANKDKKKKDEKKDGDKKDEKKTKNDDKSYRERDKDKQKKDDDKNKSEKGDGDRQEAEEEEDDDDEEGNEDEKGKKDKKKKERKKYQTLDPELLLASVYFDQNHTGYILDKDLEEIVHTVGLQLSRAQVRKFVQKVVSRDSFNYRKLTDRPVDEPVVELESIELEKLAEGNIELLHLPAKIVDDHEEKTSPSGDGETTSNLVTYKGSMLDIESVMQRLEKSDKTRQDMEAKMKELTNEIGNQQKQAEDKDETMQKVQSELKQVKQQLAVQSKLTSSSESISKRYLAALTDSKEHLCAMISTVTEALGDGKKDIKKEKDVKKMDVRKTIKKEPEENGSS